MAQGRGLQLETALDGLLERARAAQILLPRSEDRVGLEEAARRVRAQVAGSAPGAFIIALAGGTGAGKSTLINALAGASIADVGERRPTTSRLHVYHHHELPRGGLPPWLAENARFVTHDRDALRGKVLIDTPDLDSFVREHRELTRELLKAAGLVLYVLSGEKYLNEDILTVLREERRFSGCAVVLNKIDLLGGAAEVEKLGADLHERLGELGVEDAPLFRTVASRHVPGASAAVTTAVPDDFGRLEFYIERELQASEMERLRRRRQAEVYAHLREEVDRAAPPDLEARLARFGEQSAGLVGQAAEGLCGQLAERLALIDQELAPLAAMAWHQRFWGPLRTWLGVSDFTRYGLVAAARRFILRPGERAGGQGDPLLGTDTAAVIGQALTDLARRQQDLLYQAGLPLGPWQQLTHAESPARRSGELADAIRASYLAGAGGRGAGRLKRGVAALTIFSASAAGAVVGFGLAGWGLFEAIMQTLRGEFQGANVLGHVATLILLVFVLLQVLGDMLYVRPRRRGRVIAGQVILEGLRRWSETWVAGYRGQLESEWRGLREPLAPIKALLGVDVDAQRTE